MPSKRRGTRSNTRAPGKAHKVMGTKPPKLILAYEQRAYLGGVPFETIKAMTPDELFTDRRIYDGVAVPLFGGSSLHLRVSLRLLLKQIGARPTKHTLDLSSADRSGSNKTTESQQKSTKHLVLTRSSQIISRRFISSFAGSRGQPRGSHTSHTTAVDLEGGALSVQRLLAIS